jgi:hypothetical protein
MSGFGCSWAAMVPQAMPRAIIAIPSAFKRPPIAENTLPSPPDRGADISDAETAIFVHLTLME